MEPLQDPDRCDNALLFVESMIQRGFSDLYDVFSYVTSRPEEEKCASSLLVDILCGKSFVEKVMDNALKASNDNVCRCNLLYLSRILWKEYPECIFDHYC